jgi:hypothetical protein
MLIYRVLLVILVRETTYLISASIKENIYLNYFSTRSGKPSVIDRGVVSIMDITLGYRNKRFRSN